MTQISQQHEERRRYVEAVTSSADTNKETLRAHLTTRFAGRAGAAEAVAAAMTLLDFERALMVERLDTLGGAELKLTQEVGEDQAARADRDAPHKALLEYLERLRRRVAGDAGDKVAQRLGLLRPPSDRLAALVPFTQTVIQLCREANLTLTDPMTGAPYSTAALASGLQQRLDAFNSASAEVTREERETQAARAVRDDAVSDFTQDVYAGAQLLEALYRQAGMSAHAERIRPTSRRVAGRLPEDPLPSAGTSAAGTPAPTDDTPTGAA